MTGKAPRHPRTARLLRRSGHRFCNPVFEDQDVQEAARLMQEQQVRRLVVLDRDKRLVGIVSVGDLAVETGNKRLSGGILQEVSQAI